MTGAMLHWRKREERKTVRIAVRVRTDAGWIDATARNVSSRGMMLQSLEPLHRNQFVEVAKGRCRTVGRIVWSRGSVCGVHTRDRIDLSQLLAGPGPVGTPQTTDAGPQDRRATSRAGATGGTADLAFQAETSRMFGRAFERVVMVGAITCAALLLGAGAYEMMSAPMERVDAALGGPGTGENDLPV